MCNAFFSATGKAMAVHFSMLILAASLLIDNVEANASDRYRLPPSKVYIEPCRREALRLHSGMIDNQRILPQKETFWIRYEIEMHDGVKWSVVCDLATGSIIREQRFGEDEF